VFFKFNPGLTEKGNGYWKINNSVLQEEEYKKIIINLIDRYLKKKKTDIILLWDALKVEIKEITSIHCKNKAKHSSFYYIFHIKPHFFKKISLGRLLYLFEDTQNSFESYLFI
jgi:hypothetical protein